MIEEQNGSLIRVKRELKSEEEKKRKANSELTGLNVQLTTTDAALQVLKKRDEALQEKIKLNSTKLETLKSEIRTAQATKTELEQANESLLVTKSHTHSIR